MASAGTLAARIIGGLMAVIAAYGIPAATSEGIVVASYGPAPVFGEDVSPTVGAALLCSQTPGDAFCGGVNTYRPIELDEETAGLLARINLAVNVEIEPVDDIDLWQVPERWSRPVRGSDGALQDDCDGYVIEKWYRLVVELGLPRDAFYPLYAEVPGYGGHLVLAVYTSRGTLVLDNLTDDIVTLDRFSFSFLKRPQPGARLDGAWERYIDQG